MYKRLLNKLLLSAVLLALLCDPAQASLSSRIDALIRTKTKSKTKPVFAVKVINAATGKTVYAYNAAQLMIPASNMKIITTAAALAYLGPDYQFATKIGLLDNSLVVIGAGDPLFGSTNTAANQPDWIFTDIIESLRASNITSLTDIIIDSSFFDDIRVHPSWPPAQLNQPYACELSGLNYNSNCVNINVKRLASRPQITVTPRTDYVTLTNKVKLTSSGSSAVGSYRNSKPNNLIVFGKCRKESAFDVAIEQPAMLFGYCLSERLNSAGIDVTGVLEQKYIKTNPRIRILKVYTTPISDVMAQCNKSSFGLAAESLVKTISAENTAGRINGQWRHGFELIADYLHRLGINDSQFVLDDGSGLSRLNRLTPNAITTVLQSIYTSNTWPDYKASLAVGGLDGTIAKYFHEEKYRGKILGKTGYIKGVRTFSGICQTQATDYIFSIMTTGGNANVRKTINNIAKAIIDTAP